MSRSETITADDGHSLEIARADPPTKPKGGVIVLHAIYGVTDHIRSVCDKWAAAGYAAAAPALFDRVRPGLVHGYDKIGAAGGRDAYAKLGEQEILCDIRACMTALRGSGPTIVSGFCTGGTWAWVAGAKLEGLAAQVNFYGSHVAARHLDLSPRCPTIMHYGDNDHVVPLAEVERIRATQRGVRVEIYPRGGHAFFNPDQEHYDAQAATEAWTRSLAFLDAHIGRP